jgi:hypothetical protein
MWAGLLIIGGAVWTGCQEQPSLTTQTFNLNYLRGYEVESLLAPYVYTDRRDNPGMMSVAEDAITVRETEDNLAKIARVLEEYDRPRPSVMLHFQIIEADGTTDTDPAIADVERELRRLFRFEGYDLVAETQVGGVSETSFRQLVGAEDSGQSFMVQGGVSEVRTGGATQTVTVDVSLGVPAVGTVLETSVTIPLGHSVVLGTASSPAYEGALILVVRAELMGAEAPAGA